MANEIPRYCLGSRLLPRPARLHDVNKMGNRGDLRLPLLLENLLANEQSG